MTSLSWSPVAGAVSYDLYRSTTPGGEGTTPYLAGLEGCQLRRQCGDRRHDVLLHAYVRELCGPKRSIRPKRRRRRPHRPPPARLATPTSALRPRPGRLRSTVPPASGPSLAAARISGTTPISSTSPRPSVSGDTHADHRSDQPDQHRPVGQGGPDVPGRLGGQRRQRRAWSPRRATA